MFIEKLKAELKPLHLLNHPFYKKWSDGALSIETLRDYAEQYYHHVKDFPRCISSIHSQCDEIETRQILLDNLIDEEKGNKNHPELWLRFAEELGLNKDEVKNANLYNETIALIDGFMNLCKRGFSYGIGALFAYEEQVPEIAKSKIDGLKKFYNLSSHKALEFFQVHIGADEWHSQECADIITKLSDIDQKCAREGALVARKLLWQFLDGIERVAATN